MIDIDNVDRSFHHKVIKLIGGDYYESETETTYWYYGDINAWFSLQWYQLCRFMTSQKYAIQIWYLNQIIKYRK